MVAILEAQKQYPTIPIHTLQVLYRYIDCKLQPGTFLVNVLSNDLKGAFDYADIHNEKVMKEIVKFVYFELPPESWGNEDRVNAWIASKKHVKGTDATGKD